MEKFISSYPGSSGDRRWKLSCCLRHDRQQRVGNMGMLDANIVLRYVLDDHAELSPKAAETVIPYYTLPQPVRLVGLF